jgi:hypothetical protein
MRIVFENEAPPNVSRMVISEPGEFRLDKSTTCGALENTEVSICTNVVLWLTIIGVAILMVANTYRGLKETYEYRRMQNDTTRFVANIIPLQNVNTNVGGTDPTTILSNTVVGLQQMINTDTRTVKANFLQSYTTGGQIGVLSGLNLCNVGITSNGTDFSGTSSNLVLTVSTIVATSGTFSGICYAQQFVTLSDILAKKDVQEFSGSVLNDIAKVHPYRFSYSSGSEKTLGLLAQEVEAVWPELVAESSGKKFVSYDGVVAVLVKAVQELSEKVRALEHNSSN